MKRKKISAVLAVLLVFMLSPVVAAEKLLVPVGQTVVNLSPADLRKEGTAFDLPIAVSIIAASRQVVGFDS